MWEYKTLARAHAEMLTEEQLNQFGAHGFELVSVSIVAEDITIVGRHETKITAHYFFKRPKPKV